MWDSPLLNLGGLTKDTSEAGEIWKFVNGCLTAPKDLWMEKLKIA